ncbi:MAG TPA: tetratricopeptide repeat protein [Anaerolineae bacterium]|nr:tetratricopeptide repeat protein [Anaerolineae bacterium]
MMETLAERQQVYQASIARAGAYWQTYIHAHQANPAALIQAQANILHTLQNCAAHPATHSVGAALAHSLHPYMIYQGQWQQWRACLQYFVQRAPTDDPLLTLWLQQHLSEVCMRLGEYAETARCLEAASALVRALHYPAPAARVFMDLAQAWFLLGEPEKATAWLPETQQLAEQRGEAEVIADVHILRGRIALQATDYGAAAEHFTAGLSVARNAGDRVRVKSAGNFLGTALLRNRQPHAALPYFMEALEIAQAEHDRPGQGVIRCNLGLVYRSLEQPQLALAQLHAGLEVTVHTDNSACRRIMLEQLTEIYAALGEAELSTHYQAEIQRLAESLTLHST